MFVAELRNLTVVVKAIDVSFIKSQQVFLQSHFNNARKKFVFLDLIHLSKLLLKKELFPGMSDALECLWEALFLELMHSSQPHLLKSSHFYLEFTRGSSFLKLVHSLQHHLSKESLLSQMSEGIFTPYSDTVLHR